MQISKRTTPARGSRLPRPAAVGVLAAVTGIALAATACSSSKSSTSSTGTASGSGKKVGVTLVLKTLTNPYFVSMQKDAQAEAAKDNVSLTVAAGNKDGDTQTQISAIDNAISRGDKGILITTNGDAVNAALNQARQAGLLVIALDTSPNPPSTADITFATDNEAAGKLIGQYAAAKLGGKKAVIAMLDLFNNQVVSVDIQRDHGFLEGMGINPGVRESNQVLKLVRDLRDRGLGVILISHNMPQVFDVADRIHIQRLGRCAGIVTPQSHSMEDAVAIMTGAKTVSVGQATRHPSAPEDGQSEREPNQVEGHGMAADHSKPIPRKQAKEAT